MIRMLMMGAIGATLIVAGCEAAEEPADNATGPGISEEANAPEAEGAAAPEEATEEESAEPEGPTLASVVAGDQRDGGDRARDASRHPAETLAFFGAEPGMTIVELWPGRGWYTDILAPLVAGNGSYVAAIFDESGGSEYVLRLNNALREKLAANPEVYGEVTFTVLAEGKYDLAPEGSADMVLTFRNVHNWMKGDYAGDVFAAMYRALKPGGVLGVVEHRLDDDTEQDPKAESGYVSEKTVIDLAEAAGFQLADRSEINANPADTKDHPSGVWTLPPSLAKGEEDKEKYAAIGESDRMTLKFVKPRETGMALAQ